MWYSSIRELEKREFPPMKKLLVIIFPVVLIIIVAIVIVPYLLNSPRGNKAVLSKISQNSNYTLEAEKLYFSWSGPQRVENLTATSSSGLQYYFPELSLSLPLWKLWKKNPNIGITRISNLVITMPPVPEKLTKVDMMDPAMPNPIKCSPPGRCSIFGEVDVTNGLLYLSNVDKPINLPTLQYACTPDRMAIHIAAQFPNTTEISYVDMECSACLQDIQVKGKDVPTYLLDQWKNFSSQISLQEIVGPTLDIDAKATLNQNVGPVSLTVNSPNLSITQSGQLNSTHYVLDEPLLLSLQLSKKVLHSLFYHPILQIDRMDEPIRVNISPQEIPLPLSLSSEINNASINIGKITCMNKDLLFHLASELLQIDDSKIDIWFSEIPVHYADGILQIFRSHIFVQSKYQLAIWGNIDCFQKKVRLKLGIPESTLKKVFGIKSLPPNCMITCAIKGNFDDIKVDTSKLIKKISILMAKEKAKKQIWKEGSNFFKESNNTPPPVQPFPWDKK